MIDASTAHRTAEGWTYGFPELSREQREAIRNSRRVANPGCHATGFIAATAPLVSMGILPKDYPLTCYSLTGYSGGGKNMIAEYEDENRAEALGSPALYGLTLKHKHIPEMQKITGLACPPVFMPVVDDYYKGMAGTIMLHNRLLAGTNRLQLIVCGNEEQTSVTALFDNLGKGASGAAVQNMNIMLGLDEGCGLE